MRSGPLLWKPPCMAGPRTRLLPPALLPSASSLPPGSGITDQAQGEGAISEHQAICTAPQDMPTGFINPGQPHTKGWPGTSRSFRGSKPEGTSCSGQVPGRLSQPYHSCRHSRSLLQPSPGFTRRRSSQHFKGKVFLYSPARSVNWPAASKARGFNPCTTSTLHPQQGKRREGEESAGTRRRNDGPWQGHEAPAAKVPSGGFLENVKH